MQLSGSLTALITPFDATGAVDFAAWQRLVEWQMQSGIDGIIVAGSTGEAAALSDDEYCELIGTAVKHVAGRIPVLAGTGQSDDGVPGQLVQVTPAGTRAHRTPHTAARGEARRAQCLQRSPIPQKQLSKHAWPKVVAPISRSW